MSILPHTPSHTEMNAYIYKSSIIPNHFHPTASSTTYPSSPTRPKPGAPTASPPNTSSKRPHRAPGSSTSPASSRPSPRPKKASYPSSANSPPPSPQAVLCPRAHYPPRPTRSLNACANWIQRSCILNICRSLGTRRLRSWRSLRV